MTPFLLAFVFTRFERENAHNFPLSAGVALLSVLGGHTAIRAYSWSEGVLHRLILNPSPAVPYTVGLFTALLCLFLGWVALKETP
jgi:hypothetical protein